MGSIQQLADVASPGSTPWARCYLRAGRRGGRGRRQHAGGRGYGGRVGGVGGLRVGGLDVLVCNHGVGQSATAGEDTPAGWDEAIRINLTGPFLLVRAALPVLQHVEGRPQHAHALPGGRRRAAWRAGQRRVPGRGAHTDGDEDMAAVAPTRASGSPGNVRRVLAAAKLRAALSSVAPIRSSIGAPCVLASLAFRSPSTPATLPGDPLVNGVEILVDGGAMAVDASSAAIPGPDPVVRELLTSR
jgi:meso-butanediol dehydrogenase/(S,S)-butanediol dehydrogenase/diacetyl reductase